MIYSILNQLKIPYETVEHDAYYTMDEAILIESMIDGQMCKNLFLRNRQTYYLLVVKGNKRTVLKDISKQLKIGHLHFGSDEELKKLNLYSGCVNPLSIAYDTNHEVIVLLDKELVGLKLLFHPNDNKKTISIQYDDLIRYLDFNENEHILVTI